MNLHVQDSDHALATVKGVKVEGVRMKESVIEAEVLFGFACERLRPCLRKEWIMGKGNGGTEQVDKKEKQGEGRKWKGKSDKGREVLL